MSLKAKLTTLIITFLLLVSLLIVGVFAVKNTNFKVGGEIVFNAKGIEATITRVSTSGFTSDKTIGNEPGNILSDIVINNDKSADDIKNQFASWSGLNFKFEEGFTTATIVLTITNTVTGTNPDNYLDISASASATTINNAKISVTNRTGGTTALLQQNESETFTITFEVIDAAYSASLKGFVINFNLQKKTFEDFPTLSADMTYQTFKFRTIEGETGLSVEDIGLEEAMAGETPTTQSSGAVKIPAYVKYEGKTYAVTKIAEGGFMDCVNLTSITIPNTVTSIAEYAFFVCQNLTSITIPSSVKSIGDNAFSGCGFTSVTIGSGVTSIGDWAFQECTGLTSVTIGNSVTSIGLEAFRNCSGLTSVTIPNSVTSIGSSAFSGCSKLTYNKISETDEGKYLGNVTNPYLYLEDIETSTLTEYTIHEDCKIIGYGAFYGCSSLTSITIPDSVTSIGDSAFVGCSGLTSITIPDGVTSIGAYAFEDCTGLTSITIPVSVTSIGYDVFNGCNALTINFAGSQAQWNAIAGKIHIPSGSTVNFGA